MLSRCYFTFISLEINRSVGKDSSLSSAAERKKRQLPVILSQFLCSFLWEIKHFQFIVRCRPPLGEKEYNLNYPHWPGKWDTWITLVFERCQEKNLRTEFCIMY